MFEDRQQNREGENEMGKHNFHQQQEQRIHPVNNEKPLEPEVMNGPSPTGLASGLAGQGKLPAVRDRLRARLSAALARIETSSDQIAQTVEAEAAFHEQWASEVSERYQETVKFFRSNGS